MQNKSISKISTIATPVMIACGLLAMGVPATANSEDGPCSNRTLLGDYGSAVEGVIIPGPGGRLPLRGVVITHYDGKGNFTQADHIVVNGVPPMTEWTPGTGTYHIHADCTGTARIVPSTGGFVNLEFVVVNRGKEIRAVVTAPFDGPPRDVTSIGIKVE